MMVFSARCLILIGNHVDVDEEYANFKMPLDPVIASSLNDSIIAMISSCSDRPAGTYPGYCHMEDAVLGWDEREKLVEFARGMRDEACNLACQLISSKTKELTGKTTDEISVSEFVRAISMDNPTSYVIADGFRILDNAPNLNCGALFLNEYDIWKVFPSSEELNDVINNAEQYILVDIDFKV